MPCKLELIGLNGPTVWLMFISRRAHIESRFLSLCQCFEGLNSLRTDKKILDNSSAEIKINELIEIAKNMGFNKSVRSKIKKSLKSVEVPSLEQRLTWCLNRTSWIFRDLLGDKKNRAREVAEVRNLLSHGDRKGHIRSEEDFRKLEVCSAIVRSACLVEIFHLAGIQPKDTDDLIVLDQEVGPVLRIMRQN